MAKNTAIWIRQQSAEWEHITICTYCSRLIYKTYKNSKTLVSRKQKMGYRKKQRVPTRINTHGRKSLRAIFNILCHQKMEITITLIFHFT